jgi:hypothetical protein
VKKLLVVVTSAVVAALVAGVVVGGASRVLMRLVSLAAGDEGGFSVGGTVAIVVAYAAFMLPGAVLAGSTDRRGRTALLVVGALLLCVPAIGVASEEVDGTGGLGALQWAGVLAAGAAIFGAIATLPAVTTRLVDRLQKRWLAT